MVTESRSFWEECWREHFLLLTLIALIGITLIFCPNCRECVALPCPTCPDVPAGQGGSPVVIEPEVPCGEQAEASGANGYPVIQPLILGTATGLVTFRFNASEIPDRFIVKHGGEIVLDTGYRGHSAFNLLGSEERARFQESLRRRQDPITKKTYPFQSRENLSDGYPKITSPGDGSLTFMKNKPQPVEVEVWVFGPDGETKWECSVDCVNE